MLPRRPPRASHPARSPAFSRSGRAPPPTRRGPGAEHEPGLAACSEAPLPRPARERTRHCPTTSGATGGTGGERGDPRVSGLQARHLPACAVRRRQCACLPPPQRSRARTLSRGRSAGKPGREIHGRDGKAEEEVEQEFQKEGTEPEERGGGGACLGEGWERGCRHLLNF